MYPAPKGAELIVASLGDINDGTGIYPTQGHHQDITDPSQQAYELSEILYEFSRILARHWKHIRWEAVPGNHGRSGKYAHEAANWDITAYRFLELKLSNLPHAEIHYPRDGGDNVFLLDAEVQGNVIRLYHGHQIMMYQNIPWYGAIQRAMRWKIMGGTWRALFLGHFHTLGFWRFNDLSVYCTGTPVSDDIYMEERLGTRAVNSWMLVEITPDGVGMTTREINLV